MSMRWVLSLAFVLTLFPSPAASQTRSSPSPHVYAPTTQRRLMEARTAIPLRSLSGLAMGETRPPRATVRSLWPALTYEYLGFGDQPRLSSALYPIEAAPISDPDSVGAVQAMLDEVIDRLLGLAPDPKRHHLEHRKAGLRIRSIVAPDANGAATMELERRSVQFDIAETGADSSDLRLLEGGLSLPDAVWESLLPPLWRVNHELARSLMSESALAESVLAGVQHASPPDFSGEGRDLLLLVADQWLRSYGMIDDPTTKPDPLGEAWRKLGFHSEPMYGQYAYCGSALKSLASRVGENRWTDRAYLILLDQGWVTDCSSVFEGSNYGNDLYVPVLAHGEAYLRKHKEAAVWPSVALRVALAHETVWSLSKDRYQNDFGDLRPQAPQHRRRALELYRALLRMTREPRLQQAIERKIRFLDRDQDTKCRVYYLEGEC